MRRPSTAADEWGRRRRGVWRRGLDPASSSSASQSSRPLGLSFNYFVVLVCHINGSDQQSSVSAYAGASMDAEANSLCYIQNLISIFLNFISGAMYNRPYV
jgi:hypothetical protein